MRISFIIAIFTLLLSGCKSIQYIPIETIRTDSFYSNHYIHDSIYVKDSSSIDKWNNGDTTFIEKTKYNVKYIYRLKHDTICISKKDSINVPYPIEKERPWWKRIYDDVIPIISAILIILIIVFNCKKRV